MSQAVVALEIQEPVRETICPEKKSRKLREARARRAKGRASWDTMEFRRGWRGATGFTKK